MKFGIISDTHGRNPPQADVPFWLHAGDIYNLYRRTYRSEWSNKNFYIVKGNHDGDDYLNLFKENNITNTVLKLDKYWIVGIGWAGQTYQEQYMIPTNFGLSKICKDVLEKCLQNFKDGDRSILITHYPPLIDGVLTLHRPEGLLFDCVRSVIDAIKPDLVVTGHTHDNFGKIIDYNGSSIVFPGPSGMLVEIIDNTINYSKI